VQAVRATIEWWIAPRTLPNSAQSTWIGIFGPSDPTTHRSLNVAQIGWKQLGSNQVRVFWEWGVDGQFNHISYGATVDAGQPLTVELDRDSTGLFSFRANGAVAAQESVSWTPSYLAIGAETHNPSDELAGSVKSPEVITGVEWKLAEVWQPLAGLTFSTLSQYQIATDAQGPLRIWDLRQPN
jgi:hypothetical protein